jgi:transposase
MTKTTSFDELRAQAIALRLAGRSRREIKQILRIGSNETLNNALRGVPPPVWTARPNAKDDLRCRARELRDSGRTYDEIASELGVSKSSVSLWVRDLPRTGRLSYEESRKRNLAGVAAYWDVERPIRAAARQDVRDRAFAQIGELSERELLIAGAVAYWCEGGKEKPYTRERGGVRFINSDPGLILLFLRFITFVGVARERLMCTVHIHESADIEAAQQYWLDVTGLPRQQFSRPTVKRHKPKTNRKNTGGSYRGCLAIRVLRSTGLYKQIEGWASAATAAPSPIADTAGTDPPEFPLKG